MSKAFTRESDDLESEESPILRPQVPPGVRNYVTREWADRVKRRLENMLEKRQTLLSARSADDPEVKRLDGQIRKLMQRSESMVVAEIPAVQDRVAFGATVVMRRTGGEDETYRIVGVEEADPEHGTISWISPVARALMSKRVGDKVLFHSPAGDSELTVLSVRYSETAAGT